MPARLAQEPVWCMLLLAVLPVALRLLLLPHHPVPSPDIYDEFGHLLVADTLRHFRLANPAHPLHQFFETFFVLQEPTYSSIYPIGQGLALAFGWTIFGLPGPACAPSGGVVRALLLDAARLDHAGLGARRRHARGNGIRPAQSVDEQLLGRRASRGGGMPGLWSAAQIAARRRRLRDAILLGAGLAIHLLTRPYESIFLLLVRRSFTCCRHGELRLVRPAAGRGLGGDSRPSASRCCRTSKSPAVGRRCPIRSVNINTACPRRSRFRQTRRRTANLPVSRSSTTKCRSHFAGSVRRPLEAICCASNIVSAIIAFSSCRRCIWRCHSSSRLCGIAGLHG